MPIDTAILSATNGTGTSTPERVNPYRGPHPLTGDDLLFGRDREVAELESLVLSQRIVVLYAASGVGKSSLLEAGLCPRFEARGFAVSTVRGFRGCAATEIAPGATRYEAALVASLGGDPACERLTEVLDSRLDRPQLLVLDQFEELFTVDRFDGSAKRRFVATLAGVLEASNRWAVIAMREEYIAELLAFARLFPGELGARMRLGRLSAPEAVKAIVGPAEASGVPFDIYLAREFAERLRTVEIERQDQRSIRRLVDSVEPIHLQLVCHSLWRRWRERFPDEDRITAPQVEQLEVIGTAHDIERVFAEYYDDAIASTTPASDERAVRDWFQQLTSRGQRAPAQIPTLPDGIVAGLEDRYLIRRATTDDTPRYELAHDRLVPAVLEANHVRLSLIEPLHGQARRWVDNRHQRRDLAPTRVRQLRSIESGHPGLVSDEERQYIVESARRRTRLALVALGMLAVGGVIVALVIWAWQAVTSAGESERQAEMLARTGEAVLEEELDPGLAMRLVADLAPDDPVKEPIPDQVRSALYRYASTTPVNDVLRSATGEPVLATAMATAPAAGTTVVGTFDGTVLVTGWSGTEPELVDDGLERPIRRVATDVDGTLVAAIDGAGAWHVWERSTEGWAALEPDPGAVDAGPAAAIGVRPDGTGVFLLDAADGTIVDTRSGSELDVAAPVGLAVGDDRIAVWTADAAGSRLVIIGEGDGPVARAVGAPPSAGALSGDGEMVALGGQDGRVFVGPADAADELPGSATGHDGAVASIVFVDRDLVVSAAPDGLMLWRVGGSAPELIRKIVNPSNAAVQLAAGADPAAVGVLTGDGTIEQWSVAAGHSAQVTRMVATPDGVVSLGQDGSLLRWTADNGVAQGADVAAVGSVSSVAGATGSYAEIGSGGAVVHDEAGDLGLSVSAAGNITASALSGDGRLALGDDLGSVRAVGGDGPQVGTALDDSITALAFSASGDELLVGTANGRLEILDARDLSKVATLPTRSSSITALAVAPAELLDDPDASGDAGVGSDELMAVGDASGTTTFWLRSVLADPVGRVTQAGAVTSIGGDLTGRRVITSSTSGWLNVWTFENGAPIKSATIRRPTAVTAFAVADDQLWVGTTDGAVAVLPLDDAELVRYLRRIASWEPATKETCGRYDWLEACPVSDARLADTTATRSAVDAGGTPASPTSTVPASTTTLAPDARAAAPADARAAAPSIAPTIEDEVTERVDAYQMAIEGRHWDDLRALTGIEADDVALDRVYADLESLTIDAVSIDEIGEASTSVHVGLVKVSKSADGRTVAASCAVWILHDDGAGPPIELGREREVLATAAYPDGSVDGIRDLLRGECVR